MGRSQNEGKIRQVGLRKGVKGWYSGQGAKERDPGKFFEEGGERGDEGIKPQSIKLQSKRIIKEDPKQKKENAREKKTGDTGTKERNTS